MSDSLFCRTLVAISLTGLLAGTALAAPGDKKPAPPPPASSLMTKFEAADKLYTNGNYEAAAKAFQDFLKTEKITKLRLQAHYYLGWCQLNQQKYQDAVAAFDALTKEYPYEVVVPEVTLKKAECYREQKQYPMALQMYQLLFDPKFQNRFPKEVLQQILPQALLSQAWTLFRQGEANKTNDFSAAKALVERIRQDPTVGAESLNLLAQILIHEKKFDEAKRIFQKIAEQRHDPTAGAALYMAGDTMMKAEKYDEAISFFKHIEMKAAVVAELQQQIRAWEARRGEFLRVDNLQPWQTYRNQLQQRYQQFQGGWDPRPLALVQTGNCYLKLGRPEEASVVFRYFLDTYPETRLLDREKMLVEEATYRLFESLNQRVQAVEAEKVLQQFKAKYSNSSLIKEGAADFSQADNKFNQKQFPEALALFEKAIAATNCPPAAAEYGAFRIAECYYRMENWDKAIAVFREFLTKYPMGKFSANTNLAPSATFCMGRAHFEIADKAPDPPTAFSNLTAAVKIYEQYRTTYPRGDQLPQVVFQLGYFYGPRYLAAFDRDPKTNKLTTKVNLEKSIAAYQDFIARWPDEKDLVPEALYQIAQDYAALEQPDDAIKTYQTILANHGTHNYASIAAFEIGLAHYAAKPKRPDKVIEAFRTFVKTFPENNRVPNALLLIGAQLEEIGKLDDAITEYRTLIARGTGATKPDEALLNTLIEGERRIVAILEKRDFKLALAECEAFLAKFKDQPVAARSTLIELTKLFRKAKRIPDAYPKLDQIAAQYLGNAPIRVGAYTSIIEMALSEKNYPRALDVAGKLSHDPEKDRLPLLTYGQIGTTFLRVERFAEAREAFKKMLTLSTNDPRMLPLAQLGLGQALVGLKQCKEAEPILQEFLANKQSPNRMEGELAMAKAYECLNDLQKAVPLYNRVLVSAKGGDASSEAACRLGNIWFTKPETDPVKAKENKKLALAYFTRLLFAPEPFAEEGLCRTAQCQEAVGNTQTAREVYQSYLRSYPQGKFAAEAKAALQRIPAPPPQP